MKRLLLAIPFLLAALFPLDQVSAASTSTPQFQVRYQMVLARMNDFEIDWSTAQDRVEKSVAFVEHENSKCSAFVIDEDRHYLLTAEHCVGTAIDGQLYVNDEIAGIVFRDKNLDLAVVRSWGARGRALKPRLEPVFPGMPIAAVGHGRGQPQTMLRTGVVLHPEFPLVVGETQAFVLISTGLVKGMSGGPMFDTDGHVVSINQLSNGYFGLGRPLQVLLAATSKYWKYAPRALPPVVY